MAASALSPLLPPGRFVDLPGRGRTFYREVNGPAGAPTVVLLHGWTASADLNFHPLFGPLGRSYRVIAPDHRGHGRGLRNDQRFTLESAADDVDALCEALGLGPVLVVGYSMGGAIAQLVWRRHRERVAGLVLCATASTFSESWKDSALFGLLGGLSLASRRLPTHLQRKIGLRLVASRRRDLIAWVSQELHRHDWGRVSEAGVAIGRFCSDDWVGDVDVPTAVVATTGDDVVEPARQLRLARSIPGCDLMLIDGNHSVCATEPETFASVLVDACNRVTRLAAARAAVTPEVSWALAQMNGDADLPVRQVPLTSPVDAGFSVWRMQPAPA